MSIEERTYENKKELERSRLQRRQEFVDLFGVPYYMIGGEYEDGYVATQWISMSPDFNQWLRWQFKVFVVEGTQSDYRIYVDEQEITQELKDLHNGNWINDPINVYGVYPSIEVEDEEEGSMVSPYYDMLEVASYLTAKGQKQAGNKLIFPGFKKLQITSSQPFTLQLYMYTKYSGTGR